MEPAGNPPQTYESCKRKNTNSQAYKFWSVNARTLTPHYQQIMIAAAQASDGKIPVLASVGVLLPQTLVGMVEEPRNFGFILRSIAFRIKLIVQLDWIFGDVAALGEIHHPFFKVGERRAL